MLGWVSTLACGAFFSNTLRGLTCKPHITDCRGRLASHVAAWRRGMTLEPDKT